MIKPIFVSYAKENLSQASDLAAALESKGWLVWWDRQIPPGRTFDEVIEEALTQARCVIVLWSAHSVASRWVRAEASVAAERGILVPVLIEDVPIPLEFRRLQAANLIDWHADLDHPELAKVIDTVGRLVASDQGKNAAPSGPPVRKSGRVSVPTRMLAIVVAAFVAGAALMYMLVPRTGTSDVVDPTGSRQPSGFPAAAGSTVQSPGMPNAGEPGAPVSNAPLKGRINLLAQKNGGHLLAAPNDSWSEPINGDETWDYITNGVGGEAVYGFKDDQPATFDTFSMLISDAMSWNVKEFELLVGNDAPLGYFESVGKFETKNIRLYPSAWQEFKFPPQRAKYFKVRILSTHVAFPTAQVFEWQLMGSL